MSSLIRKYWKALGPTKPWMHPEDAPIFCEHEPHTFNLDYPPPAFIGDVDNAPVVILMANGGYSVDTKSEFAQQSDYTEYLEWLKGERRSRPQNLSSYYTHNSIFPWVEEGKAVIVNAVAYRSRSISKEPRNERLANALPSLARHRQWLCCEVLPAAKRCERLVVAHRWRLWGLNRTECTPGVLYSRNPGSPYLSNKLKAEVDSWLLRHCDPT